MKLRLPPVNRLRIAMPAASLVKAALSAAAVGLFLAVLRHAGPRASGLAAAVPINSMPALFWLSVERGGAYAVDAALGSLLGTGLTVLAGVVFGRMAAALAGRASRAMRPIEPLRPGNGITGAFLSVVVAGAMSLLVSELSRHGGPRLCGLVAAVPVVGMLALYAGYRQGGAAVMFEVLRGYLDGMWAKAACLATLGSAWAIGAGLWAWPMALAVAALTQLKGRRDGHPESHAHSGR